MTPARPVVVFDLGGVLIDWDPRHLYRKMFDDQVEMERFLANICTPEWNHQMDGGLPFEECVASLSAQHPEMAAYIEAFWTRWSEMIAGPIDSTVDTLEKLHSKGVSLYALSNWSAQTWPYAANRFAFFDLFDGLVISGFEKTTKPDPAIFKILIDRYAIDPRNAVFIDDSAENVEAAERLGFHGIVFREPAELSNALADLGIL